MNPTTNPTSQVTAPPKRPKASAMLKSAVKDAKKNPSMPIVGTDWDLLSKYTGYNPQKPVAITQEVNEVKATQEVICLKVDFFKTATGICKPDVKSDSESEYEPEEPEDPNSTRVDFFETATEICKPDEKKEDPNRTDESMMRELFPVLTDHQISQLLEFLGRSTLPVAEEGFPIFFLSLGGFQEALQNMVLDDSPKDPDEIESDLEKMRDHVDERLKTLAKKEISIVTAVDIEDDGNYTIICNEEELFFLTTFNSAPFIKRLEEIEKAGSESEEDSDADADDFRVLDVYIDAFLSVSADLRRNKTPRVGFYECFRQLTDKMDGVDSDEDTGSW